MKIFIVIPFRNEEKHIGLVVKGVMKYRLPVVLVDDGLATGVTAGAAIASVKLLSPKKIIFAVPVCSADTAGNLKGEVDELLCLHAPIDFIAVGRWYLDFKQTSDHEVIDLLNNSKRLVRVEKVEESPHYPRAV